MNRIRWPKMARRSRSFIPRQLPSWNYLRSRHRWDLQMRAHLPCHSEDRLTQGFPKLFFSQDYLLTLSLYRGFDAWLFTHSAKINPLKINKAEFTEIQRDCTICSDCTISTNIPNYQDYADGSLIFEFRTLKSSIQGLFWIEPDTPKDIQKNEYSIFDAAIDAAQQFWAEISCNTRIRNSTAYEIYSWRTYRVFKGR